MRGFTLIETMIALAVLTFGLLAAGQMLFIAASLGSLARSKGTAAIIAQHKIESLENLYQQDPSAADLTFGRHGPEPTNVINPANGIILNQDNVAWNVSSVLDARPGVVPDSRLVTVIVAPALLSGAENSKPGLNKILNVTTIFSPKMR
jgi:prepilin-type N-terminal cleavage/methylation domain-containing protein